MEMMMFAHNDGARVWIRRLVEELRRRVNV
jgi:hypothetical protein